MWLCVYIYAYSIYVYVHALSVPKLSNQQCFRTLGQDSTDHARVAQEVTWGPIGKPVIQLRTWGQIRAPSGNQMWQREIR